MDQLSHIQAVYFTSGPTISNGCSKTGADRQEVVAHVFWLLRPIWKQHFILYLYLSYMLFWHQMPFQEVGAIFGAILRTMCDPCGKTLFNLSYADTCVQPAVFYQLNYKCMVSSTLVSVNTLLGWHAGLYSGSNNYLIPCWFCRFAHLQRVELCIILIIGTF